MNKCQRKKIVRDKHLRSNKNWMNDGRKRNDKNDKSDDDDNNNNNNKKKNTDNLEHFPKRLLGLQRKHKGGSRRQPKRESWPW